jgi:hypothetical protein
MHHSGAFRAAGMRARICCLKIESVHVVPGKRQRDPGPITTAVPIVQAGASALPITIMCVYGSLRAQGRLRVLGG